MNQFPLMRIQGRNALRVQHRLNSGKNKMIALQTSIKDPSVIKKSRILWQLQNIRKNLYYEKRNDLARLVHEIIGIISYLPELSRKDCDEALMFIDNMKKKMNIL